MRARFLLWIDSIRSSYGFLPSVMLFSGGGLALLLVALDRRLDNEALTGSWWIFGGGADGARAVLSAIASSVMGVAGTTFSITMAVLSLTSSQFGPRLLRGFLRDTGNQLVLGTFLGTFLYCLLVLRAVRSVEESVFVPHVAITGGLFLALASVFMLVFFIHHVSRSIQASEIIAKVARDLDGVIDRLYPDEIGAGGVSYHQATQTLSQCDASAASVKAAQSGYLQALDGDALVTLAQKHNLVIYLTHRPGDFINRGSTIARVTPADAVSNFGDGVQDAFALGQSRTDTQDVGFVVQQLVEVAVRALSPGINDPFTALSCLDRLGAGLCSFAGRDLPAPVRADEKGVPRLVTHPYTFADILETALGSIRLYGKTDPQVMSRIMQVIADVGDCARNDVQRAALRHQADLTWKAASSEIESDEPRQRIEAIYHETLRRLTA